MYECFICMHIFVPCVHSALRVQKKALGPLEWELQVVVSTIWVLKTESEFSARGDHLSGP